MATRCFSSSSGLTFRPPLSLREILSVCVCVCVQVLYRKQGHSQGTLYTTSRRYIDLPLPSEGNYVVEVRAHTEGGDGAVAQIQITGGYLHLSHFPTFPSVSQGGNVSISGYRVVSTRQIG